MDAGHRVEQQAATTAGLQWQITAQPAKRKSVLVRETGSINLPEPSRVTTTSSACAPEVCPSKKEISDVLEY